MVDLTEKYFLMIEPDQEGTPSEVPLEDELTQMVDEIFAACVASPRCYKGFHTTKCHRTSDNKDWVLPNGMITNSLCTYYVRYYRPFIPQNEIEKIRVVHATILK